MLDNQFGYILPCNVLECGDDVLYYSLSFLAGFIIPMKSMLQELKGSFTVMGITDL